MNTIIVKFGLESTITTKSNIYDRIRDLPKISQETQTHLMSIFVNLSPDTIWVYRPYKDVFYVVKNASTTTRAVADLIHEYENQGPYRASAYSITEV